MLQIAIDGEAGAGKSTVSKILAQRLNCRVLNTGDIYRAFTIAFMNEKVDSENQLKVQEVLDKSNVEIKYNQQGKQSTYLNGEDVTEKLHENVISENVSLYAKIPIVRKKTVVIQRKVASDENIVLEGRDIGTVVLPNANFKFYVTASAKVRAERRYKELIANGEKVEFDKIYEEIVKRDTIDRTRECSPLKVAEDGIIIDTSNLTVDEAVEKMVRIVKENYVL